MDIILCYPKFLWEGNELQVELMKLHEDKCPVGDMHIYLGNLVYFWGDLVILGGGDSYTPSCCDIQGRDLLIILGEG
jgi:hypothetical protein